VVVNGIYWEPRFPRLVTAGEVRSLYAGGASPRLRVIGDITCDIGGSVEVTVKETNLTEPVFVYDPASGKIADGWQGRGPVVMAVDKLPAELPREATEFFGDALEPFVPRLSGADFSLPADRLDVPAEFRRALIAHRGELTPEFSYLYDCLHGERGRTSESRDS
jgi:alpha-aminoadipic semialdehyde synthase